MMQRPGTVGRIGRLGLVAAAVRGAFAPFNPASLFASGEQGLWYDVSDFSTLFQDAAGTVPVTAVEQPVGLILDKRLGATNYNPSTMPVAMYEGTGASTISRSGETLVFTSAPANDGIRFTSISIPDTFAEIEFTASGTGQLVVFAGGSPSGFNLTGTPTRYRAVTAPNASSFTIFRAGPGGLSASVIIHRVTGVRGNHASQATTTARGILRARYNLYLNSETLSTQNVTVSAGQHRLRFEGTGTITLSGAATGTLSAGTHTITCTAGTLTSTVSGTVTNADLRAPGIPSGLPPYQRIDAATDYDTAGFPVYLDIDGTDDSYQTGSINFSGTDKMTIWAGMRKLDDTVRMFCELSTNTSLNPGSAYVLTGNDSGRYSTVSRGSSSVVAGHVAYLMPAAPDTAVITATHDIAGDLSTIRRNGSSTGAIDGTADKGTGNFGNYPMYLFSRGGTSLRWKGQFYGLIIRGAATDTAQLEQTEQWLNSKMGGIY